LYVGTGTGPAKFKLQAGSSLIAAANDGLNIGAYASAGQTEQIGCDFATYAS